jgi:TonB-dependent receptor
MKLILQTLLLVLFGALNVFAQKSSITGVVTDSEQHFYLQGANVRLSGTAFGSATDRQGRYRIVNVPAGTYTLVVSYLGYETSTQEIEVPAGMTKRLDVELKIGSILFKEIVVEGIRQGQAQALNIQQSSETIKNVVSSDLIELFPDPNAAEAIQRIPAISIQRDQGEGRYILIRGTEARLNSMMINGERIPSPEGDVRSVALDVVPADALATIEVTKALTADMDADAIGGSVNLITRSAFDSDKPILNAHVGGGYNNLVGNGIYQISGTYGRRLGEDNKFGFLVGASYYETHRGSDNNEMEWGEEDVTDLGSEAMVLQSLELRDYVITRKRLGITGSIDYRWNDLSQVYFRSTFNNYSDQEYRRLMTLGFNDGTYETTNTVTGGSIERQLKDRYEVQKIQSYSFGGVHRVFSQWDLDYKLSYSYAEENEPRARYSTFQLDDDADFSLNLSDSDFPKYTITNSADQFDPAGYVWDEYSFEDNKTTDQDRAVAVNLKIPFNFNDHAGFLKFGGKYHGKEKDRKNNIKIYGLTDDYFLSEVVGGFEDKDFLFNEYRIGRSPDPKRVRSYFSSNPGAFEEDEDDSRAESDPVNYEATEDIMAAYGLTTLYLNDLTVQAGARFEQTAVEYKGNVVEFDENGDLLPTVNVKDKFDYGNFFPSVHLKYRLGDRTNLRAAWTNTMARPNYYDVVPYQLINREDEEIESGNVGLKPTTAMNLDLMGEHYLQNVGVVSAGVFYKSLDNFIYPKTTDVEGGVYDGYEQKQPVNGEKATLFGLELNWQQQLTFLPGHLNGLGVYANYTYATSTAKFPDRDSEEDEATLPGQSTHMANFALSYEKGGFNGRISANVHGKYLEEVGETKDEDIYYDNHFQLDVSMSQQIRKGIRVYLELINLTNAPLRYYQGVSSRPIQQEYYSWWGNLGVKFNF